MANTHDFSFDQAGVSLIADITEAALEQTKKLRITVASDDTEARHLLAKRIIQAIEAGETDILRLRDSALLPTLD